MDFIIGFPSSNIMVIIDQLSKLAHFVHMRYDQNNKQVVEAFITYIIKLHGILNSIISDPNKAFMSAISSNNCSNWP